MPTTNKKNRSIPLKKKLILLFLAVFILTLFISSFNTKGGLLALYRQKLLYDQLKAEIEFLKEENRRLAYEIKALREDPFYIEKIAREELTLAREGEIIYLLPKNEK
jgi:cell division protein FtsB